MKVEMKRFLPAHNEKIAELCNKIDAMKAKSRTLKSPTRTYYFKCLYNKCILMPIPVYS